MEESLIRKITEETISRLKTEKKLSGEILLVIMGGDNGVDEALNQIKCLSSMNIPFSAYMTKAAERIIGRDRVLQSGVHSIIQESQVWDRAILERFSAIIVPVLTLNGLSKIANMIADNAASNLLLLAFRHNKKIIFVRDSVLCCGGPEPPATSAYMRKINEMINTLRNFGAMVISAKNLAREAADYLNMDMVTVDTTQKYTNNSSSACLSNTSDCSECGLCVINRRDAVKAIINAGADRIGAKNIAGSSVSDMASYIDHTALKADATQEQIGKLCEEAKQYNFATVCVNPVNVKFASQLLSGSKVGITTVIGFPLGATTPTVKALEARDAIANGADEIDMVINVGALKSGNYRLVEDDIRAVREATRGKVLKVILETSLLSKDQIVKGCQISKSAGADFVKTSTGFSTGGATVEDIRLMRETVGPQMGVKASGGVRTGEDAENMIKAGATRIGASASVAIVTGGKGEGSY